MPRPHRPILTACVKRLLQKHTDKDEVIYSWGSDYEITKAQSNWYGLEIDSLNYLMNTFAMTLLSSIYKSSKQIYLQIIIIIIIITIVKIIRQRFSAVAHCGNAVCINGKRQANCTYAE